MLRYHYFIHERNRNGGSHPVYDCYNHEEARRECQDLQIHAYGRGLFFIHTHIDAYDLTRTEQFVQLLMQVRALQKEYFSTRDHETMKKAMAGEKHIDDWIARYTAYREAHPDYRLPYPRDQQLFDTVAQWRDTMRQWSRHKPKDDLKRQLKTECQLHETVIDNLIDYRLSHFMEFR